MGLRQQLHEIAGRQLVRQPANRLHELIVDPSPIDVGKQLESMLVLFAHQKEEDQLIAVLIRTGTGEHPSHFLVQIGSAEIAELPVELISMCIAVKNECDHECPAERQQRKDQVLEGFGPLADDIEVPADRLYATLSQARFQ
ncbi:hypothetical protein [Bradyrhizobium oligotrophicum]|uniref:hypothetical protein n=1 Tax=Bradyrhizobium oligotrophicum TaxID=44255 RepID=UPI003671976E